MHRREDRPPGTLPAPRPVCRRSRLVALAAGALLAFAVAEWVSAQATWLDAPPRPWNSPAAAIPAAPPAPVPMQEICLRRERAPSAAEEMQVAAAGWRHVEYWATQRRGSVAVVLATSNYDGMCRPIAYNAFAFVDGRFAGTLSPDLMISRFDGALSNVPVILPDGQIEAVFIRYAPTDPLCCPSRPPTRVSYRMNGTPGTWIVVPHRIAPADAPPARLPRTGGSAPASGGLAGAAGIGMMLAGLALRRMTLAGRIRPLRHASAQNADAEVTQRLR